MTRRILSRGVVALGAIALLASSGVFVGSLAPNDRSRAGALTVSLSEVPPGHFKAIDRAGYRVFVVHSDQGAVSVLAVATRDGAVLMPDVKWWRFGHPCATFGPESRGSRLVNGGHFQCADPGLSEYQDQHWRWSSSGEYLGAGGSHWDDMQTVQFERSGSWLLIKVPG